MLGEICRQQSGLVAMSSKFGWLVSGPIKNSGENSTVTHSNLVVQGPSSLDSECTLEKELRRFWDIESLGILDDALSEPGTERFPSQISYDFLQGCYRVGLPWKLSKPESTNYALCIRRQSAEITLTERPTIVKGTRITKNYEFKKGVGIT